MAALPSDSRIRNLSNSHLPPRVRSQSRQAYSIERPSSTSGSLTQTETSSEASSRSPSSAPLVLRLRGAHDPSQLSETSVRRRIQWAEEVVDNEGLGRKKSKVCCIYHKQRAVGESSSEDDSSSDESDGDVSSGEDDGKARMASEGSGKWKRGRRHGHDHEHGDDCGREHGPERAKGDGRARGQSPNAYEKMPKYHGKKREDTAKDSRIE